MASTNKTTNYELSQFLGTDKPAWLSDYNTDMNKIDTQMKANADGVTSVSGTAGATATALGDITSLATTDKTSAVAAINEVNTKATTAQGTATSANNLAGEAKNTADGIAEYLSLTGRQNLTVTTTQGVIASGSNIASAYNSDGTLGKVYGNINLEFSGTPSGSVTVTISDTGLRPTENLTINAGVIVDVYTGTFNFSGVDKIVIHTDGTVTITVNPSSIITRYTFILPPCLYFMKNFGD